MDQSERSIYIAQFSSRLPTHCHRILIINDMMYLIARIVNFIFNSSARLMFYGKNLPLFTTAIDGSTEYDDDVFDALVRF